MKMSEKKPDWDKITEGKIRHGIAVEAFSKGMELNAENMKTMERWVQFVIHGYDGIKNILDDHKTRAMSNGQIVEKVKDTFDGEEVDTDKYIADTIEKAAVGLDRKNKNIVMARLRDGKINTDNLQACLDRIEVLKKG